MAFVFVAAFDLTVVKAHQADGVFVAALRGGLEAFDRVEERALAGFVR